ncbi:sensor histidine kinase [Beutenbergia cavernae]|nr:histidine kinase [Beutenbergia cavernae]
MGRWRLTRAADVVAAAVVLLLTVPSSIGLLWSAGGWASVVGGVCGAVLVATLLARRAHPWPSFWASCAALLVLLALPRLPEGLSMVFLPVSLIHLLVVHAVVAGTGRWRLPLAVSLVGLGLIVARTVLDVPDPLDWGTFWVLVPFTALVLAGSCVLGARDWERRQLQEHRLHEAVARERELMAREVHDVVAHSLTVVVAQADAALLVMEADPQRSRTMVSNAVTTGREAMAEMQRVVRVLRDGAPPGAPVRSLHDLDTLVASSRSATAGIELVVDGDVDRVDPEIARAVYRIVQESLTNAVKHGTRPPRCRVDVRVDARGVSVSVHDDGPGLTGREPADAGFGILGIRERARSLGGRVDIASDASGTRVSAWLPTT